MQDHGLTSVAALANLTSYSPNQMGRLLRGDYGLTLLAVAELEIALDTVLLRGGRDMRGV